MKTSILYLAIFTILLSVNLLASQNKDIVPEPLKTIYLESHTTSSIKSHNVKDEISLLNMTLVENNIVSFNKVLKTVDKDSNLFVNTHDMAYVISERDYLKRLRKSVNKSESYSQFKEEFKSQFPEIYGPFANDYNLRSIYYNTRENSINGYIKSLPTIL